MNVSQFRTFIVEPGLLSLPAIMKREEAAFLLCCIGGQESAREERQQQGGPAHGFFQFEQGGIDGLMGNAVTALTLRDACLWLAVPYDGPTIYQALLLADTLAVICARLLLWADPDYVPPIGDSDAAWQMYLRCWRPGKPDQARWNQVYAETQADWATPLVT